MASRTEMLYQNADKTVVLIDIPTSIISAQGPGFYMTENNLSSRAPPAAPFPITNEPKSQFNNHDAEYHGELRRLVHDAIKEIKSSYTSEWCLPRRWTCQIKHPASKKRKSNDEVDGVVLKNGGDAAQGNQTHLSEWQEDIFFFRENRKGTKRKTQDTGMKTSEPCILSNLQPQPDIDRFHIHQIYNRVFHNSLPEMIPFSMSHSSSHDGQQMFHIPTQSTFLLASIQDSIFTFKSASLQLLPSTPTPGQFDFILLDPPWPNASAKRARSYQRPRSLQDISDLLTSIQLEDHIAPEGYVGVWMTNKPAIRELIMTHLFEQWDLDLVEEWIWIKTTVHGEPITDLDSKWRKPYEVMLLGKRRSGGEGSQESRREKMVSATIRRRIIAGVPDVHSRKPSLKALIEGVLFGDDATWLYRALEIFARHLTAGWWAWGDEVLKFNCEGAWVRRDGLL
ncbi:MAG: hypothetical protein M1816_005635 [Peltula sp. TS41687]|nr:MAG: hypothetical protein M1816_005635 [Peltula sp. TS41687]